MVSNHQHKRCYASQSNGVIIVRAVYVLLDLCHLLTLERIRLLLRSPPILHFIFAIWMASFSAPFQGLSVELLAQIFTSCDTIADVTAFIGVFNGVSGAKIRYLEVLSGAPI